MLPTQFFYRDPMAPKPNRPIGVGVLALIERDSTLLLECRSDCGRWGLVGGSLDPDESLEDGLTREVFEETGLSPSQISLFGTFSDPSRIIQYSEDFVMRVISLVYRVRVDDFSPLRCSAESTALNFFTRDELLHLDVVETARPVIDRYLSEPMDAIVLL